MQKNNLGKLDITQESAKVQAQGRTYWKSLTAKSKIKKAYIS